MIDVRGLEQEERDEAAAAAAEGRVAITAIATSALPQARPDRLDAGREELAIAKRRSDDESGSGASEDLASGDDAAAGGAASASGSDDQTRGKSKKHRGSTAAADGEPARKPIKSGDASPEVKGDDDDAGSDAGGDGDASAGRRSSTRSKGSEKADSTAGGAKRRASAASKGSASKKKRASVASAAAASGGDASGSDADDEGTGEAAGEGEEDEDELKEDDDKAAGSGGSEGAQEADGEDGEGGSAGSAEGSQGDDLDNEEQKRLDDEISDSTLEPDSEFDDELTLARKRRKRERIERAERREREAAEAEARRIQEEARKRKAELEAQAAAKRARKEKKKGMLAGFDSVKALEADAADVDDTLLAAQAEEDDMEMPPDDEEEKEDGDALLDSDDDRFDLYNIGDTSSESVEWSTDSDEEDRELAIQKREEEAANKELQEHLASVLTAPREADALPIFMEYCEDRRVAVLQEGVAPVPGEFWGGAVGGDVGQVVPPVKLTAAQEARLKAKMAKAERKLKRAMKKAESQGAEESKGDASGSTRTRDSKKSSKAKASAAEAAGTGDDDGSDAGGAGTSKSLADASGSDRDESGDGSDEQEDPDEVPIPWAAKVVELSHPTREFVVPGGMRHEAEWRFWRLPDLEEERARQEAEEAKRKAQEDEERMELLAAGMDDREEFKTEEQKQQEQEYYTWRDEQERIRKEKEEMSEKKGALRKHRMRSKGLVMGETAAIAHARRLLAHPEPPVPAVRARLAALSRGMTPTIVSNILLEHPSKQLLCQWVLSMSSREELSTVLHNHYDVPIWHCDLLASRLMALARTDLIAGVISHAAAEAHWRYESVLAQQARSQLRERATARIEEQKKRLVAAQEASSSEDDDMVDISAARARALKAKQVELKRKKDEEARKVALLKERKEARGALDAARFAAEAAIAALKEAEDRVMNVETEFAVTAEVERRYRTEALGKALAGEERGRQAWIEETQDARQRRQAITLKQEQRKHRVEQRRARRAQRAAAREKQKRLESLGRAQRRTESEEERDRQESEEDKSTDPEVVAAEMEEPPPNPRLPKATFVPAPPEDDIVDVGDVEVEELPRLPLLSVEAVDDVTAEVTQLAGIVRQPRNELEVALIGVTPERTSDDEMAIETTVERRARLEREAAEENARRAAEEAAIRAASTMIGRVKVMAGKFAKKLRKAEDAAAKRAVVELLRQKSKKERRLSEAASARMSRLKKKSKSKRKQTGPVRNGKANLESIGEAGDGDAPLRLGPMIRDEDRPLPPPPAIRAIHRTDWMERYIHGMAMPERTLAETVEKYREILAVTRDFERCATGYACKLIEEKFLPQSQRQLPLQRRRCDIRGNVKEVFVFQNVWFRFALDYHGIFNGSDEYAMKATGNAVRASRVYTRAHVSGLVIPFCLAVDFRGFRVFAEAGMPLGRPAPGQRGIMQQKSSGTRSSNAGAAAATPAAAGMRDDAADAGPAAAKLLVLGSLDRGATISNADGALTVKMEQAATTLNLAPHTVRGSEDLSNRTLQCAADLRGYRGTDGRHYIHNFWRALPPEDPDETPFILPAARGMSIFWRCFRPEFLRYYPRRLSPDALSAFQDNSVDGWQQSKRVTVATRVLMKSSIPAFAEYLSHVGSPPSRIAALANRVAAGPRGRGGKAGAKGGLGRRRPKRAAAGEQELDWRGNVVDRQEAAAPTVPSGTGGKPFQALEAAAEDNGDVIPLDLKVLDSLIQSDIAAEMHHRGIPIRHLGALRARFWFRVSAKCSPVSTKVLLPTTADARRDVARGAWVRFTGLTFRVSAEPKDVYSADTLQLDRPYPNPSLRSQNMWTGAVVDAGNSPEVRAVLLAEMAARVIKQLLRRYQRLVSGRTQAAVSMVHEHLLMHVLNCVSGSHTVSEAFWATQVQPMLLAKFGERALSVEEMANLRPNVTPLLPFVVRRLTSMLRIVFSPHVSVPDLDGEGEDHGTGADDMLRGGVHTERTVKVVNSTKRRFDRVLLHAAEESSKRASSVVDALGRSADGAPRPSSKQEMSSGGLRRGSGETDASSHRHVARPGSALPAVPRSSVRATGTGRSRGILMRADDSAAQSSDVLSRFAAAPEGFAFTPADVYASDALPRVRHNMVLQEYAEARVLAAQAKAEAKFKYEAMIRGDDPACYWPLTDRPAPSGGLWAQNRGVLGASANGKCTEDVIMEADGVVENAEFKRCFQFYETPREGEAPPEMSPAIDVAYSEAVVPLNPTQAFSIEAWCFNTKTDFKPGMVCECGRYSLYVSKHGFWVFSVYCGDVDADVALQGPLSVLNTWQHVAATFDGTMARLYIGGKLMASCEVYAEAQVQSTAGIEATIEARKELDEKEKEKLQEAVDKARRKITAWYMQPDGMEIVRRDAQRIRDRSEFRARLQSKKDKAKHAIGFKAVGMDEAIEQVRAEKIAIAQQEAEAKVKADFDKRRADLVRSQQFSERAGAQKAREPLRIGGSRPSGRAKWGKNFWQGRLSHIAYYTRALPRGRLAAHVRRGTVSAEREASRLFHMAVDRFRAALVVEPENDFVLAEYCSALCKTVRNPDALNDVTSIAAHRFQAKVREAMSMFVARRSIAGLATLLEHLPPEFAMADLACDIYDAMRTIEPSLALSVPEDHDSGRLLGGSVVLGWGEASAEAEAVRCEGREDARQHALATATKAPTEEETLLEAPDSDGEDFAVHSAAVKQERELKQKRRRLGLRGGVLGGYRTDAHIVAALSSMPRRFHLTGPGSTRRHAQIAATLYRAVVSRTPRAFGGVPLDWITRIRTPEAVVAVVKRADTEGGEDTKLDLSRAADSTEEEIATICSFHRTIASLSLAGLAGVTDSSAAALAGCRDLLDLDLSGCEQLSDRALMLLGQELERLEGLNLARCTRISDAGVVVMATKCDMLVRFTLDYCALVSDAAIKAVAAHCPDLESLSLQYCPNISDAALAAIGANKCAKHIRRLILTGCRRLTDRGIDAFTYKCVALEELSLEACRHITDNGAQMVINRLWKLEVLNLSELPHITSACMQFDTDVDGRPPARLQFMRRLRTLRLADCDKINDDAIALACKISTNLQSVTLSTCNRVTDLACYLMGGITLDTIDVVPEGVDAEAEALEFEQHRKQHHSQQVDRGPLAEHVKLGAAAQNPDLVERVERARRALPRSALARDKAPPPPSPDAAAGGAGGSGELDEGRTSFRLARTVATVPKANTLAQRPLASWGVIEDPEELRNAKPLCPYLCHVDLTFSGTLSLHCLPLNQPVYNTNACVNSRRDRCRSRFPDTTVSEVGEPYAQWMCTSNW